MREEVENIPLLQVRVSGNGSEFHCEGLILKENVVEIFQGTSTYHGYKEKRIFLVGTGLLNHFSL